MLKKYLEPLILVMCMVVVILIGGGVNGRQLLEPMQMVSLFGTIVTLLYIVVWLGMITYAIIQYKKITLFAFGLFWLISFLVIVFLMLASMIHLQITGVLAMGQWIFYAPLYGLSRFFSDVMTYIVCASGSLVLGILGVFSVRRSKNSISQKEFKRLMDQKNR